MSSSGKDSHPVSGLQDRQQENTIHHGSTKDTECALAIPKTFQMQEEMVLAQIGMWYLLLPQNKEYTWNPSNFFQQGSVQHR